KFFFFSSSRRHTRWPRDWSSDVCSSDLNNFASRGFLLFNTFEDLLTGNILEAFVGTGITDRGFRARDASSYFQDDWKVMKRLTLNLGVRYDYLGPSTDVKNRLGNFDPSRLDATTLANGGA